MVWHVLSLGVALWSAACEAYSKYDRDIVYEFQHSTEGWGSAASSEMQMDVAARGGDLVGTIGGGAFVSAPHLDSPPLLVSAAGRQSVAIRMKYQGGGMRGARLSARYGGAAPSPDHAADHGRADWTVRGPPVPVGASGGPSGSAINDDDAGTTWRGGDGDSVVYAFREAEAGARTPTKGAMAHGVSEVELRCDSSDCPWVVKLQAEAANASQTSGWATLATLRPSNSTDRPQFLSTRLSPDDRHAFWRVVVEGPTTIAIRELRLLPCVVEARFGISPSPAGQEKGVANFKPLLSRSFSTRFG